MHTGVATCCNQSMFCYFSTRYCVKHTYLLNRAGLLCIIGCVLCNSFELAFHCKTNTGMLVLQSELRKMF